MPDLAPLKLDVIARTAPFVRELNKARKSAMSTAGVIQGRLGGAIKRVSGLFGSFTAQLGLAGGAAGLAGLTAFSVKLAADAETLETSFATMLGSVETAKSVIAELDKFSAATPFEPTEIKEGAKQLLAFGVRQEDLIDRFKVLGDIAAGSGARIGDLVSIFGKTKSAGVVALGDLNQLGDRAIPIFETLKRQFGVSGAELRKMVSAGKLQFPDLLKALRSMTSEGGLFADAMVKQSSTLSGLMSTVKGNIDLALTAIGKGIAEGGKVKGILSAINDQIKSIDAAEVGRQFGIAIGEMIKSLGKLVEAFGVLHAHVVKKQNQTRNFLAEQFASDEKVGLRDAISPTKLFFKAVRDAGRAERRDPGRFKNTPFEGIGEQNIVRVLGETARNQAKQATEDSKKVQNAIEQLARSIRAVGFAAPAAAGKKFDAGPFEAPPAPEVIAKKTAEFFAGMFAKGAKRKGGLLPGEREPVLTGGGPLATPFSQPRLSSAAQFGTGGALSALNRARTGQSTDGQKIVEELRKLGTRLREIHVALAKNPPTRLVPAGLDRA